MAVDLYEAMGFTVVERNFRCLSGEVDLIVWKDPTLVFCEVKTRRSRRWGEPAEAVRWEKQARLRRIAGEWLTQNRPGRCDIRFDVVSVIVGACDAEIVHLPGAF